MGAQLHIYFCVITHNACIAVVPVQDWTQGVYEETTEALFVVAPSRGKAKSMFINHIDPYLEWTTPMSIRKVKHEISPDELEVGFLNGSYWIDDDMVLHDTDEVEAKEVS